jgi:hypothetical protein
MNEFEPGIDTMTNAHTVLERSWKLNFSKFGSPTKWSASLLKSDTSLRPYLAFVNANKMLAISHGLNSQTLSGATMKRATPSKRPGYLCPTFSNDHTMLASSCALKSPSLQMPYLA